MTYGSGRSSEVAVAFGISSWLIATALSQHPMRSFDRLRNYDRTGLLIPNWRFFAPEPAIHDFRILYRWLGADGTQSDWHESHTIDKRHWRQTLWFPARRRDKALSDVCNEVIGQLKKSDQELTSNPAYRLLRDFVAHRLATARAGDLPAPEGFQFLVVSDAGYDETASPLFLFASRFEPFTSGARA